MEPYGLHSLTYLLNHPYLVRNRLAESLYGETGVGPFTRLQSRANGRHRFQEQEVKDLIKILTRLANLLERRAEKLEKLDLATAGPRAVRDILDLKAFNAKPLIEKAVGKGNYFAFYDRARLRGELSDDWRRAAAEELRNFANEIRDKCAMARQEARRYPFSVGRGGGSHLG
jgi:hypothetical protein